MGWWGKGEGAGTRSRPQRLSRIGLALAIAAPLVGTGLAAFSSAAAANGGTVLVEIGSERVGSLQVVKGRSQNVRTSKPFVDLVVGDPEIADVMPLTDRTLYVLGRKPGITNVSVFDAQKQLVGVIDVTVGADARRLEDDIERSSRGADARVGNANGATVLQGEVPDGVAAAHAMALARQHAGEGFVSRLKVSRPQQVMLEVRFVEASRNLGKDLGVDIIATGENFGSPNRSHLNLAAVTGLAGLASGATPFGTFVGRVLSSGVEVDLVLKALEDRGLARRLAEPNLVAMSGEKASFLAGGEFPIPVQGDFQSITIEYKKFGVGLTFVPTVLEDGVINLKIEPEVSQIDPTVSVRTGSVSVPGIIVRRASTVVDLRDGQSFAIAGLLQSYNSETQKQLPWLGDVPVIGALFRSAAFERKETELAIIVTPRFVKPAKPGDRLLTPVETAVPASEAEFFLTGRQEFSRNAARGSTVVPVHGHILDMPAGGRHVAAR